MATKKFPSEMSSRGTVLGTDKILIYNATTGASDEVCTVAELFAAITGSTSRAFSASTLTMAGALSGATRIVINDTSGNGLKSGYSTIYAPFVVASDLGTGQSFIGWNIVDSSTYALSDYSTKISGDSGRFIFSTAPQGTAGSLITHTPVVTILNSGATTFASTIGAVGITLTSDNANKPGAGGLWTVVSDERIKKDIELADLDICYDTIKNIPLKRYAWADGVYSEEQVSDRHNLGWIAQDVQKYFSKAVSVKPFTKNAKIADGTEEYQEQDFVMEDKKVTSIEMINGSPVQVTKIVQEKVLLFDEVQVKDELGKVVLENGKPILAKVPKMVTKTRPKFKQEVIEDCLDLNSSQLSAALYGAVQKMQLKIESLEQEIALLKQ